MLTKTQTNALLAPAFTAADFPTPDYYSAADEAKFVNGVLKLIASDFADAKLTKDLYNRLHCTFGFIAHFNIHGFRAEYFRTTEDKVRFLDCIINGGWGLNDVERAIRQRVIQAGVLQIYRARLTCETEVSERATLAILQRKYAA